MKVAGINKVAVKESDIVVSDNNKQIRVPATYVRPLLFARVIGWKEATVGRAATARLKGFSTPQISPIGISSALYAQMKADYAAGLSATKSYDQSLVNHKKDAFDSSKFILFDLRDTNAKSPTWMARQIIGDDIQTINLGDIQSGSVTETALNASGNSQYGKYEGAMTTIFQRAAASPWLDTPVPGNIGLSQGIDYLNLLAGTEPASHPRVFSVLVTPDAPPTNGSYNAVIQALAPVYIQRVYSDGKGDYHTVFRFLPDTYGAKSTFYLAD